MKSVSIDSSISNLALAAQADLVAITVEMLRSPQSLQQLEFAPWFEAEESELKQLIERAFGEDAASARDHEAACHRLDGQEDSSVEGETPTMPTLAESLREVQHLARQLDLEAWSDEYWRLFDSSQACALNQASYIRRDKGTILGDLCGFYAAFGWQGNPDCGERPDHLISQLEFTCVLLAMASQATQQEQREVTLEALNKFARLHMHDWMPSVCYQMIEATQLAYFGAVAQWLLLLWMRLAEHNGWPMDDVPDRPMTPTMDPEDPYECGAPDLIQLNPAQSKT